MLHYLPHIPFNTATPEQLGVALWLDKNHYQQLELAVNNGIASALGGDA